MSKLFIRVKRDWFIYDYNPILAANPACEVITEEEAYPERFLKEEVVVEVEKKRKRRGSALDLATVDIPEPPAVVSPELAADASRGLPQ